MDLKDYLTAQNLIAILALYGAVLSTFNFIRERRKEKLKIEVSSDREIDLNGGYTDTYIVNVLNHSFFKIEVLSAGFAVFSDPDSKTPGFFIFPRNKSNKNIDLPVGIEVKMLFRYPIEADIINNTLLENRLIGRIKLQPCAVINNKRFFGKSIYFNAISKQEQL